jgi:hypothetical protein
VRDQQAKLPRMISVAEEQADHDALWVMVAT